MNDREEKEEYVGLSFGKQIIYYIKVRVDDAGIPNSDDIENTVSRFYQEEYEKFKFYKVIPKDEMDYMDLLLCLSMEISLQQDDQIIAGEEETEPKNLAEFVKDLGMMMKDYKFPILQKRKIAKTIYGAIISDQT